MGACCTKDPREGQTDVKEAQFDNQLIIEHSGRPGAPAENDSKEDVEFKRVAATMKSSKPETNVMKPR